MMSEIKTTTIYAQMCECGRLYKDRRDINGKMMCSLCYSDCDMETLKMLWSKPMSISMNDKTNRDGGNEP